MSERPIEEVIGWEWFPPEPDVGIMRGAWAEHRDGKMIPHDHATADDLAAWLDRQDDLAWGINRCPGKTSIGIIWRGAPNPTDWPRWDSPYLPSILAALTAAVRKVAGDE